MKNDHHPPAYLDAASIMIAAAEVAIEGNADFKLAACAQLAEAIAYLDRLTGAEGKPERVASRLIRALCVLRSHHALDEEAMFDLVTAFDRTMVDSQIAEVTGKRSGK